MNLVIPGQFGEPAAGQVPGLGLAMIVLKDVVLTHVHEVHPGWVVRGLPTLGYPA